MAGFLAERAGLLRAWGSTAAVALVVAGVLVGGTSGASVSAAVANRPALRLSTGVATPTTSFTVSGTGFTPNTTVELFFDSADLATATSDASGTLGAAGLQIPTDAAPGLHWVSAVDASGLGAQRAITVGSTWPGFMSDGEHTGLNATESVLSPATVPDMTELWTGRTGGAVVSSPAVDQSQVYVGSRDGLLYAFPSAGCGASSCAPAWTGKVSGPITSSPAVSQGVVFVGSEGGGLYAFNASCGNGGATCLPLWKGLTGGPVDSSPLVVGSSVFVASSKGRLYAFSRGGCGQATCAPIWFTALGAPISSSPAFVLGDSDVVVGTSGGAFVVLRASTGAIMWHAQIGGSITGSPAVLARPALEFTRILVGSGDGNLYELPAKCGVTGGTCAPLWSIPTGGPIESSPALAYDEAYVGSDDGKLYAWSTLPCSAPPCQPTWSATTGGRISSSPAVADGVVFVGSGDSKLYAFEARGLAPLWTATTGGPIESSPAIADGRVYVGSDDGSLHVYGLSPAPVPPPKPSLTSLTALRVPIRHVVVLYQENHSFDNVLGYLCVADHRCDGATTGVTATGQTIPLAKATDIVPVVPHTVAATTTAIDGGKMDGFSRMHNCTQASNFACYTQYQPSQIPALAALARRFVISDRTFEFTPAASWAGHMLLASGRLDGFTGDNPPRTSTRANPANPGWGCDSNLFASWQAPSGEILQEPSCIPRPDGSGPFAPSPVEWETTIMDDLDQHGYTWRLYDGDWGTTTWPSGYGWAICPTFSDCLYGPQAQNMRASSQVVQDARSGALPSVSLVQPDAPNSQHNSFSMIQGDDWIASVVNALETGPEWNSTAIFITYDDCGCFYDHVPPPSPTLGVRLPMVIVSPYARAGFTDSGVATQASILAYTEHVLGIPPLTQSDRDAYDYSSSFDYSQQPLLPVPLHQRPVPQSSLNWMKSHPANPDDPT